MIILTTSLFVFLKSEKTNAIIRNAIIGAWRISNCLPQFLIWRK